MKKIILLVTVLLATLAFNSKNQTSYKCLIQMKNYHGEGAYISISVINPDGSYLKTLQVLGDDEEWYSEIYKWWEFQKKSKENIDAISGATISGGQRKLMSFLIDDDKIDKGYKIRFETSVENNEYYKDDVEFDLTSETIDSKVPGKGFIRYVRLLPKNK